MSMATTIHRDLYYVTDGHPRQTLDLYVSHQSENTPLLIWIHGGAWRAGNKEMSVPLIFLAEGYAIASINYRLSDQALYPAQIEDCKAAVRWLRAHADEYGLDPKRFAAWGASAGGHLAALLGTAIHTGEFDVGENLVFSSHVQAIVDFFGPTDFLQMDSHRLSDDLIHDAPDSPESQLVGGPIQENPTQVAKANPIPYIRHHHPPFLIVHGDSDPLVPHHQSVLLDNALRQADQSVSFYTVKGGGHGGFDDPEVPRLVKEFLAAHLRSVS